MVVVMVVRQDGAGEGGGISDPSEYGSEKENFKDFALWKVRRRTKRTSTDHYSVDIIMYYCRVMLHGATYCLCFL